MILLIHGIGRDGDGLCRSMGKKDCICNLHTPTTWWTETTLKDEDTMLNHKQKESLSLFLKGKLDEGAKMISSKDIFEWCDQMEIGRTHVYDIYGLLDEVLPIFRKKTGRNNAAARIYEFGKPMISKVNWNIYDLPLEDEQMQMVITDPPWCHDRQIGKAKRAADYNRISYGDLIQSFKEMYRVLERGGHMYCWTTTNFMHTAYNLLEAARFVPLQVLPVVKLTKNGKLWYGLGNYYRNVSEYAILAGKEPISRLNNKSMRGIWFARFNRRTGKPIKVEQDWIKESTSPFQKVLYVFSGLEKPFTILDRELILVDQGFADI